MQDSEIITLFFNREQRAIEQTGIKYGRYCHTIAWNILYSHEDAEECVNDTYLDTWNEIPPARPFSLKAFVGRITRNNAINRLEYNTALKRGAGESTACLDELAECVSGRDELTQQEDYRHLVECINRFLATLSPRQRVIFVKRYWYGSAVREICEECGVSESNVKVMLSRMRKKLREYLEKEGVRI